MIVVDTNVIVYSTFDTPKTVLARRVSELDPLMTVPRLWRYEFLNVVTMMVRQKAVPSEKAEQGWADAVAIFGPVETDCDPTRALRLALSSGITAYDAQFIALAEELGAMCVTEDQALLRAFPKRARSLEAFCRE